MSKKQLIMDKSLELFANQGFEATSVQQITDYCGISKGAFYLSFKSKDELIVALIDHFMQQLTVDIDLSVRTTKSDDILYYFYHTTFQAFLKHANFVKLLMKEQTHSLNDELLTKMRYYDRKTDQTILTMIEKVYGEAINKVKYDLIFAIKGLINGYSSYLLFNRMEFDVDLISRSLVEKTDTLARSITIPFITEDYGNMFQQFHDEKVSEDDLYHLIEETIDELGESIEKESLILLKEQIRTPTYHHAIVIGLIENIKNHSQYKWLTYLLTKHFDF
ncbi:TetR/AcrR family transcriptional regulator [Paucisalibacillus sp. EB02]|uniref:TetR/AcrR family transcriptional regulator n=1 Tax=Paucisalibacillus sp. EB02 TaxID=1347087 RepID=UPI0005AB29DE|nr:TetR/AcrR family transcriptional regulator [Paucisalibacillus sp. EB02]